MKIFKKNSYLMESPGAVEKKKKEKSCMAKRIK